MKKIEDFEGFALDELSLYAAIGGYVTTNLGGGSACLADYVTNIDNIGNQKVDCACAGTSCANEIHPNLGNQPIPFIQNCGGVQLTTNKSTKQLRF